MPIWSYEGCLLLESVKRFLLPKGDWEDLFNNEEEDEDL